MIIRMSIDKSSYCRILKVINEKLVLHSYRTLKIEDILEARKTVLSVYMNDNLENYLVQLIMATRHPEKYDTSLKEKILYGASPRATIALDKCAKINAWLKGRDFVIPEDIHDVVHDVLRHRIILSFEAQAEGLRSDDIISNILKMVPLP